MSHLAVVLPGSGYGPAGPVLLLPVLALEQRGAVELIVRYPDWRPDGFDPASLASFVGEVRRRLVAAVSETPAPDGGWTRVTFVAKSLGTLVLSQLDAASVPGLEGAERRAVWLTPLLGDTNPALDDANRARLRHAVAAQRAGVVAKAWPSLLVAGGADPYHDQAAHDEVAAAIGASSLVIDGADHSLHVAGDVLATVEGLRRLTDAVLAFDAG